MIFLAAATAFHLPQIDYTGLLPELIMMGGGIALLALGALRVRQIPSSVYSAISGGIGVASLVAGIVLWEKIHGGGHPLTIIDKALVIDGFSTAFVILAAAVIVVTALVSESFLSREGVEGPEYHALILLGASGAMFMATANDLIVIFLGLEIMSIPLYVLAAMDQRRARSGEAGMKYFVLGAFSSAIFVYGIALTYGATGSTNLAQIGAYLAHNVSSSEGLLLAGAGLLLVGFLFKVAAVPFHFWTPDVYEGAPTPATGFMAAIAKVGGFAALLRVFFSTFHVLSADWQPIIWVVAVATLVLGAVMGLVQKDIKRLLAYSSINHAGFILVGLEAASTKGVSASLYYVFVYVFMVLGSFAIVTVASPKGDGSHLISSYRGFGRRRPALALAFAVLLVAQAGAPFTTGFFGKLYVIEAAVGAHSYGLAVIAMLTGAVAAAYYLRVVFVVYSAPAELAPEEEPLAVAPRGAASSPELGSPPSASYSPLSPAGVLLGARREPEERPPVEAPAGEAPLSPAMATGLGVTTLFTVVLGIWPAPLFSFVHAASLLFH